jgi:hypothetical protein
MLSGSGARQPRVIVHSANSVGRPNRQDPRLNPSPVLNETVSLLQGRGYLDAAFEFLENARSDWPVQVIYPDAALQGAEWDLLVGYFPNRRIR